MTRLPLDKVKQNTGQIDGLPSNPRQWTQTDIDRIARSLAETPELFEARPLIVYPQDGEYIILGGNLRYEGAKKNKMQEVPVHILEEGMSIDKLKEIVVKDNGSFGDWDMDALANEWDDLPLKDWGVDVAWDAVYLNEINPREADAEEIERKKREFEEKMAAGEISEEDEEYQEFLDKFKLKKTTDDCYTPAPVYAAVARYVAETYNLNPAKFVRPFYPNGDYQSEKYDADCVVVDNPPFSIMSEILKFYKSRNIKFFLFAPTLTLFSSSSSCTALCCNLSVIYENGAAVNTSFLTNLEPRTTRLRSAPKLQEMVQAGVEDFLEGKRKELPKYVYPPYIITSSWVGALSRLGIEFEVPVSESEPISGLDSQKPSGKVIYGKGYIVSERVKAEREKAEREKAEREKAEREKAEREKAEREKADVWELSEREKQIIKRLER